MDPNHNEVHIHPSESGHLQSTDCWCEPVANYWITDEDGDPLFVVEHEDNHDAPDTQGLIHHHSTVLSMRDSDINDWITQFLERIN